MPTARLLPPSPRAVRIALGSLWLIDAVLQARPRFFAAGWWRHDVAQSVMGQPAVVNHSIFWAVAIVAGHAAVFNALFVAVQAAIGLALVTGRWDRAAIAVSIPWALGVWWVGEGFGNLPTGFALAASGSPGPVLLYPLIGLLARPRPVPSPPGGGKPGLWSWAILWAGQALLLVPFAFPVARVLHANVEELSRGLPHWQLSVASWTQALVGRAPVLAAALMASVQVAVGVGVLGRRTRRPALLAGIAVSAFYWVCFQYLGGVTSTDGTDPGAAPLTALLALALWPPPDWRGRKAPAEGGPPLSVLSGAEGRAAPGSGSGGPRGGRSGP